MAIMENLNFLSYTVKRNVIANNPAEQPIVNSKINYYSNSAQTLENVLSTGDVLLIGNKKVNLFGSASNIDRIGITEVFPIQNSPVNQIKFSTAYKSFTPAELSKIKQMIYNLHQPLQDIDDTAGGNDNPTEVDPGNDNTSGNTEDNNTGNEGTPTVTTKSTFIGEQYDSFCDAESMFTYLERITNGEITKDTGISKSQLIKLTQNETAEDNNYDFFGTLNRIFDNQNFNTNEDSILSYDEINAFIGDELGQDYLTYLIKVNSYANELQSYYSQLEPQEKLEFAIEKTQQYLEAAGLTKQQGALTRLIEQEDTFNTEYSAKCGNIVMTKIESDNDDYITLGAYSSMGFSYSYNSNSEKTSEKFPFTGTIWGWDNDEEDFDGGITLNEEMLNYNWYELVDTMVHELTHATAYKYYPDPAYKYVNGEGCIQYSYDQLETIKDILEADGLYDFYRENLPNIINEEVLIPTGAHAGENAYDRLMYLLESKWGEYTAYQTDADYVDSIAGDIFNSENNIWNNNEMTTAVSGPNEAETIQNYINSAYNTAGMTLTKYAASYGVDIQDINDNDENSLISYGDTIGRGDGEYSIYSKEAEPDYEWATYEKNKNWSWNA